MFSHQTSKFGEFNFHLEQGNSWKTADVLSALQLVRRIKKA